MGKSKPVGHKIDTEPKATKGKQVQDDEYGGS